MPFSTESVITNKQGILAERERRHARVEHLPYYYHVHLNQPCNQRCIMCVPNGRHGRAVLPLDRFTAFFEQIRPYAEHLTLIGGEPLMYPWIDDVLERLALEPIAVSINTNGTMFGGRMAERLLALHELYLRFSIDAATPGTYHQIRGTDAFARVVQAIQRFGEAARTRPRTHVITNYVVMRRNLHEVLAFVDLARTFRPLRVEFHPVRHVGSWHHVSNGTGWEFDGAEQSCGTFVDEYNETMSAAAARCRAEGLDHDITFL